VRATVKRVIDSEVLPVRALDEAAPDQARDLLRPCCASSAWLVAMTRGRPYGTLDALIERSDGALALLDWPDVEEALAAHPRIGQRAAGSDRESAWSRQEQSPTAGPEWSTADDLVAGNLAYEERFGHVFLIRATGRSAEEMLTALRERLRNDVETERVVVRGELAQIVRLRLAKTFR
jgi:2-oxo-4-hydroxy-4-carboxy-5-ureidoimidazoline decarboxylase